MTATSPTERSRQHRARESAKATAQAKRVEELEAALRAAEDYYQRGILNMTAEEIANVHTLRRQALEGGAKA